MGASRQRITFLKLVNIFGTADKKDLLRLCGALVILDVNEGYKVISQGSDGYKFYLVESDFFEASLNCNRCTTCGPLLNNCTRAVDVLQEDWWLDSIPVGIKPAP